MTNIQKAVIYITNNNTLSFHHVAVKFGVNAQDLLNEYKASRKVEV